MIGRDFTYTVIVTGGAGFIGSNFILDLIRETEANVVNVDALTYAGQGNNLETVIGHPRYHFIQGSIADTSLFTELLHTYKPRMIVNFAAESHVDRSISDPAVFIDTNIVGTFNLLETTRHYWNGLSVAEQQAFRFLHVSTDEVFGSLLENEPGFTELTPYQPNSPYSASKAASDHLVRAWYHTYGLPAIITNCSNNYGPYQYPEKLIPRVIAKALKGESLPIYGDGGNIRDWLYVNDHCRAIRTVLAMGKVGETYNVGGNNEKTNLQVVHTICDLLDALRPRDTAVATSESTPISYRELIEFVEDRAGHDRRYAVDATKLLEELQWSPMETFESGIAKTVSWYLENEAWIDSLNIELADHVA